MYNGDMKLRGMRNVGLLPLLRGLFQVLLPERLYPHGVSKQPQNPRYLRAQRECEELYRRIGQRLGEDAQLIDRYDAARVHVMTFDDEHIYHQGFLDCIYLLRWLGLL